MWVGRCVGILLIGLVAGLGRVAWPCSPQPPYPTPTGWSAVGLGGYDVLHRLVRENGVWAWTSRPIGAAGATLHATVDGGAFDEVAAIRALDAGALLVATSAPQWTEAAPDGVAVWILREASVTYVGRARTSGDVTHQPLPFVLSPDVDGSTVLALVAEDPSPRVELLRHSAQTSTPAPIGQVEGEGCGSFALVAGVGPRPLVLCGGAVYAVEPERSVLVGSVEHDDPDALVALAGVRDELGEAHFLVYASATGDLILARVDAALAVTSQVLTRLMVGAPLAAAMASPSEFVLASPGGAQVLFTEGEQGTRSAGRVAAGFVGDLEAASSKNGARFRVGDAVYERAGLTLTRVDPIAYDALLIGGSPKCGDQGCAAAGAELMGAAGVGLASCLARRFRRRSKGARGRTRLSVTRRTTASALIALGLGFATFARPARACVAPPAAVGGAVLVDAIRVQLFVPTLREWRWVGVDLETREETLLGTRPRGVSEDLTLVAALGPTSALARDQSGRLVVMRAGAAPAPVEILPLHTGFPMTMRSVAVAGSPNGDGYVLGLFESGGDRPRELILLQASDDGRAAVELARDTVFDASQVALVVEPSGRVIAFAGGALYTWSDAGLQRVNVVASGSDWAAPALALDSAGRATVLGVERESSVLVRATMRDEGVAIEHLGVVVLEPVVSSLAIDAEHWLLQTERGSTWLALTPEGASARVMRLDDAIRGDALAPTPSGFRLLEGAGRIVTHDVTYEGAWTTSLVAETALFDASAVCSPAERSGCAQAGASAWGAGMLTLALVGAQLTAVRRRQARVARHAPVDRALATRAR